MKKKVPKYTPEQNNQYFYRDSEMFRATMEDEIIEKTDEIIDYDRK